MLWGHGQNAICSGSCVQAKRIFLQSKNIADLKVLGLGVFFFVCFWSFARHTGFVAAGKMQIMVLV